MKTNLDKSFKTNAELDSGGVWFNIDGQTRFLVSRFSPDVKGVREVAAKVLQPYSIQIKLKTLTEDEQLEIAIKTFVFSCVKDWDNVEIDGEFPKFDKNLCVKLFLHMPQLYRTLEDNASEISSYREVLGNSSLPT